MGGATDQMLLDAVRRRLRHPAGWLAVCLHLSRVGAPGVRPHHRLIARVLLEDTARRHEGEVFATARGDLLLLCRATPPSEMAMPQGALTSHSGPETPHGEVSAEPASSEGAKTDLGKTERVASPEALPAVLARLLGTAIPDAARLISTWSLDVDGETVLACAEAQPEARSSMMSPAARLVTPTAQPTSAGASAAAPRAMPGRAPAKAMTPVPASVARSSGGGTIRLQTAVILSESGAHPLFREVTLLLPAAPARSPGLEPEQTPDPFLIRHVAPQLDQHALAALEQASGRGGPLDPLRVQTPPLHLNLSLDGVRSAAFGRLARALLERGPAMGAEIPLLEACAEPDGFAEAQRILQQFRIPLILDEVSPIALRLVRAAALRPDMVKLAWSQRLAAPGPEAAEAAEGILRLLGELGPDRVILGQTAGEDALRWGLAHGIRRFQGSHVDNMLRALRMAHCAHAGGCTPTQCLERAAASSAAARRLCWNHPLLDGETPPAEPPDTEESQAISPPTDMVGQAGAQRPAHASAGADA